MQRVLVVEDDQAIRQSVEYALRRQGYEVRSIADGGIALETIQTFKPELIVLDVMLPTKDGLQIAEAIRLTDPETAIIMVSALGEESDRIGGLRIGADDYLAKPFSMDELIARIEVNLRRVRSAGGAAPITVADLTVDPDTMTVTVGAEPVQLRSKELGLLLTLIHGGGKVMTRQAIGQEVWGYEYLASSRTIDVHIRRLRAAIEDRSAYHLIETVHGVGYRFKPRPKEQGAE